MHDSFSDALLRIGFLRHRRWFQAWPIHFLIRCCTSFLRQRRWFQTRPTEQSNAQGRQKPYHQTNINKQSTRSGWRDDQPGQAQKHPSRSHSLSLSLSFFIMCTYVCPLMFCESRGLPMSALLKTEHSQIQPVRDQAPPSTLESTMLHFHISLDDADSTTCHHSGSCSLTACSTS